MKHLRINVLLAAFMVAFASHAEWSQLELPDVPSSLRTAPERAAFIVAHYFDKLDRVEPDALADKAWVEETFGQFIGLVPYAAGGAREAATTAFGVLARRFDIDVIDELAESYLHNPSSPACNDSLYIAWLDVAASTTGDALRESVYRQRAEVAARNMPGTVASDFAFTPFGSSRRFMLSDLDGAVILVFFDPDCFTCRMTVSRLSGDVRLRRAVEEGRVTVLAVYHDADPDRIADAAAVVPGEWLGVWEDGTVGDEQLYELILTPTIYVLDADHRVVQRNPPLSRIEIPE